MSKKQKKNNKEIQVSLAYTPSSEAGFRLTKGLLLLLNERDILNHFQKSIKKNDRRKK